ncbi:MAG: hypothetical protein IJI10_08325 [Eubacterium sp.]|nr:hypothetical protein [Eubacterium sp.]
MKKLMICMLSAVMLLGGCAGEKEAEPADELTDEKLTELLCVYASAMDETYGADVDFTTPSFTDELAGYYEVKNYASIAEIKEYIAQYLEAGVYDEKMIDNDFIEKDGKVYAVRGGRGYGYYGIDPSAWEKTGDLSAAVQFTILGDPVPDASVNVTFSNESGFWKITEAVLPEEYK